MEDVVKHAKSYEATLYGQSKLSGYPEINRFKSDYKRQQNQQKLKNDKSNKNKFNKSCNGCGGNFHGFKKRSTSCPAWGKTCNFSGTPNHHSNVCRQKPNDSNDSNDRVEKSSDNEDNSAAHTIAHVRYEKILLPLSPALRNVHLIEADLTPFPANGNCKPTENLIFPDSGASICLAETEHLPQLDLAQRNIMLCYKRITAVGGSTLICKCL